MRRRLAHGVLALVRPPNLAAGPLASQVSPGAGMSRPSSWPDPRGPPSRSLRAPLASRRNGGRSPVPNLERTASLGPPAGLGPPASLGPSASLGPPASPDPDSGRNCQVSQRRAVSHDSGPRLVRGRVSRDSGHGSRASLAFARRRRASHASDRGPKVSRTCGQGRTAGRRSGLPRRVSLDSQVRLAGESRRVSRRHARPGRRISRRAVGRRRLKRRGSCRAGRGRRRSRLSRWRARRWW